MRREKLIRVLPFFSETRLAGAVRSFTNSWTECLIAASACGGNIGFHACSSRAGARLSLIQPNRCAGLEVASQPDPGSEEMSVSL
jgi:hypothetical protein